MITSSGRRAPLRAAAEVGAVLLCALEVLAWQEVGGGSHFAVALLGVLAVVARRWWPWGAALVAGPVMGWSGSLLAPLVLLFTAGHRERSDRALLLLAGWTAVVSAALYAWPLRLDLTGEVLLALFSDGVTGAALVVGAVGLGRLVRARALQLAALRELEAGRARERALAEHAARADERAQLAREMHDVVASQVTLIAVQAGGLRMLAGTDPRVTEVAEAIRGAAAQTTRELREVLTALRTPAGDDPPGARADPPWGLAEVHQLWASSGARGDLVVRVPEGADVPAPVQRAAYRTVQEGLTNATRYAPGAAVRVEVDVVASALVVSVANGPAPAARACCEDPDGSLADLSTGNGLLGVRERAEAAGGHARWECTGDGGFQLTAVLPLCPAGAVGAARGRQRG